MRPVKHMISGIWELYSPRPILKLAKDAYPSLPTGAEGIESPWPSGPVLVSRTGDADDPKVCLKHLSTWLIQS